MSQFEQRMIHILLVEDNEADAILAKRAFNQSKVKNKIHVAANAEAALELAKKTTTNTSVPAIDLILLDINLPGRNGFDILKDLKTATNTRDIPVIMLSSSESDTDIEKSYDLQASSYITKPKTTEEFNEIVQAVEMCWFKGIARLHKAQERSKNQYAVRALTTMVRQ